MKVPPEKRFSEVAADYAKFRPSYPQALLQWVAFSTKLKKGMSVADIGCGTGISTRLWAALGYKTVGIDPNEAMLAQARKEGGEYRQGDAYSTGLAAGSIDLASVAQAYHWFDIDKAQEEFARILKPSGFVCAFWNLRARVPLQIEYEKILARHCTDWEEHPRGRQTVETILNHPRTTQVSEAKFVSAQPLSREGFFGRVRSASYVAHGLEDPDSFWGALDALFDKHQKNDMIDFTYDSVAVLWKIR